MIPKLVAHRGYMKRYPENSFVGLETSLKSGACMVEFDIQMNADHEFILLHDSDFRRTAARPEVLFDLKTSALSDISAHEPERFGDQFLTTPVPTLKQIMELVASYPDAMAFIEIKDESLTHWGLDFVMDKLHHALKHYVTQSVIIAFNSAALHHVKQRDLYRTGWVVKNYDEIHHQIADHLQPDYLICNHQKISDDIGLWQGNWSWMLYDITDPDLALQWASKGSEFIETCDIGSMLHHEELKKGSCDHGL